MELVLTVVQAPPDTLIQDQQFVFTTSGGTIGRGDGNNCQLPCPDRVVSSQHAAISYQGGTFYLQDTSKNGTDLNGMPIALGSPQVLKNGDSIACGRFTLTVNLRSSAPALPKGLGAVDFLDAPAKPALPNTPPKESNPFGASAAVASADNANDLDSWLSSGSTPNNTPTPAASPAGWGTVAEKPSHHVDPLAAFGEPNSDPLKTPDFGETHAGIASASSPWEDDWWKNESPSDHAPADSHHINVRPQTTAPTPNVAPQQTRKQPALGAFLAEPATPKSSGFATAAQGISTANIDDILGFDQPAPAAQAAPKPPITPSPKAFTTPTPATTECQQAHTSFTQSATTELGPSAFAPSAAMPSSIVPTAAVSLAMRASPLAAALGINPKIQLPEPQLTATAAAIIKHAVGRLMDLIRARTTIKNELRVQHTTLQAQDNNPLKFSVNAEDAVNALFSESRNSSFLDPEEAIIDGFDDLSDHQMAVLAGMQAAYQHMFNQFNPAILEKQLNAKGGLLGNKRAQNWDAFTEHYARLKVDKERTYNQLFGHTFAESYEKRIAELKSQRTLRKHQSPHSQF